MLAFTWPQKTTTKKKCSTRKKENNPAGKSSLAFAEEDQKGKYETLLAKDDACFIPKRNVVSCERGCFCQSTQKPGEIVQSSASALSEQAVYCEAADKNRENYFRSRWVLVILDQGLLGGMTLTGDFNCSATEMIQSHPN